MNRGEILKSLNGFKTIKSRKLKTREPGSSCSLVKEDMPKEVKNNPP